MVEQDRIAVAWRRVEECRRALEGMRIVDLFSSDPERRSIFAPRCGDLVLDWSKTLVDRRARAALIALAEACGVAEKRDAMFAGLRINSSEGRAVLHTALRAGSDERIEFEGEDVMPAVRAELVRFCTFAEDVRVGRAVAVDGRHFTDVVNIGIGGSDLGPAMATLALRPYHDGPRIHFVSNVDGAHIADTLRDLDPARTLFIVASKTFTTVETMTNAGTARRWSEGALGSDAVATHFVAISTALDKVQAFGIGRDRVFGFWDWVGGRYSVWSAIGLPLAIAIGAERFAAFLDGAREMDAHFRSTALDRNLPVLLGLLGIWHRDVCGHSSRAVIPYDQRLARLPAYLQQLDMESNGKSVDAAGLASMRPTGPIVWGEPGTNAQHAFFQLLHQGMEIVPVEFILAAEGNEHDLVRHHALLTANCLAQSEALMRGRTPAEAEARMLASGMDPAEARRLAPMRAFPGDRPSVTILHRRLDPFALGRLIALYEHRVFVEAAIWNINAFDQWGVELGKELATNLLPAVERHDGATADDPATRGLLDDIDDLRRRHSL
jgi:glucose-6-phosphate isomerase